jgi:hypothetical protein
MKNYLESNTGKRLGITRVGMPKEVYFEAKVKQVSGDVVILEDDDGKEIVLPVEKIILIGPCEEDKKTRAGF